ncbi:MAG: indole-3-glycerol phosphate synthase TrpC [Myxococcales bacterium]|nr:indole-3-glycerol phosphate synthase TrpC [Myxococcales bacterium]
MSDFLEQVLEVKKREVEELKRSGVHAQFKRQALLMPLPPSFHDALRVPRHRYAVIGEIKRASPSAGDINPGLDAAAQAKAYEDVGLSAISVLTEREFFKGQPQDLLAAAQTSILPVLCKDFIIDPVQIYQARAFGASAVLLISTLLDDTSLRLLIREAHKLSLDPFVETHTAEEIERALDFGARVIGINSRNLRTLKVDISIPKRLVTQLPESVVRVAESGVADNETLTDLHRAGFDAFLVGQYLSSAKNLPAAVTNLMGGEPDVPVA